MMDLAIIACAMLPALLLLYYFVSGHKFHEPPDLVVGTFTLGILCSFAAKGLSVFAMSFTPDLSAAGPLAEATVGAFAFAAMPEELAKFLVLAGYCMRHSAFDRPEDGLVYGVTASLGFATIENILYFQAAGPDWIKLAVIRSLMAVPHHGLMGAIMGFFAAMARFESPMKRGFYYALALAVPITLHALYNIPFMASAYSHAPETGANLPLYIRLMPFIVFPFEVWFALTLMKRLRLRGQVILEDRARRRAAGETS